MRMARLTVLVLAVVALAALAVPGCAFSSAWNTVLAKIKTVNEDNDAQSVLSLLEPALLRTGPFAPQLVVVGKPRWLAPFLNQQTAAPVLLMSNLPGPWPSSRMHLTLSSPSAVLLVAEDNARDLTRRLAGITWPVAVRTLLWTRYERVWTHDDLNGIAAATEWFDYMRIMLLVGDAAHGSTLYSYSYAAAAKHHGHHGPREVWVAGKDPFYSPCYALGNESKGEMTFNVNTGQASTYIYMLARYTEAVVRHKNIPHVPTKDELWLQALMSCRFDVIDTVSPTRILSANKYETFPWGMDGMVAVVPAGMGKGHCLVDGVTKELTPQVWVATALSFFAVGTGLLLLGGRTRAFLDALAPLVAQPAASVGRGARRTLLASWLLFCLVLSSAYSGKLLSQLLARCASHEIQTMEQLAESNLTVYVQTGVIMKFDPMMPGIEAKLLQQQAMEDVLDAVANGTAAIVVTQSSLPFLAPQLPRGAYKFAATARFITSMFLAKKGSPTGKALGVTLGRFRAAGLGLETVSRFENMRDTGQYVSEKVVARQAYPRVHPLDLIKLRVGFVILAGGLLASTAVFAGELLVFRLNAPQRGRPGPFAWTD